MSSSSELRHPASLLPRSFHNRELVQLMCQPVSYDMIQYIALQTTRVITLADDPPAVAAAPLPTPATHAAQVDFRGSAWPAAASAAAAAGTTDEVAEPPGLHHLHLPELACAGPDASHDAHLPGASADKAAEDGQGYVSALSRRH
ncbi:hypothetical protein ONZ51_g213 [Trametes cubensis]|uniref:Uncharacterized protein n=1 Tax=Trametes cubensis TaxID=1111947 RepID=A0AAD7XFZ1_9APHY|nr:hypothetical protein ONZ51_g213 [Trametes cubensis]